MEKRRDYTEFLERMRNSIPDAGTVKSTGDRIISAIESGKYSQSARIIEQHRPLWKFYLSGAAAAFLLAFGIHSHIKGPENTDEYMEKQAALATEIPVIEPERKLMNCRQGVPFSGMVTDKTQRYSSK